MFDTKLLLLWQTFLNALTLVYIITAIGSPMNDWQQQKQWYSSQSLETRKTWYSKVAEAYNRVRPGYPQKLCDRAVEVVQLRPGATILEVGSGPGNATIGFAQLGFSMVCIEPSAESCQFLEDNCREYPRVKIKNTSFEEWPLELERFDAVLAANAFHWIPSDIGYPKAAKALKHEGCLILFWNTHPEPEYKEYQILNEIYQKYALSVSRYEGRTKQEEILHDVGENLIESGKFQDLISEQMACQVTYTVDGLFTPSLYFFSLSPNRKSRSRIIIYRVKREDCEGF